jgi:hypothetical protein
MVVGLSFRDKGRHAQPGCGQDSDGASSPSSYQVTFAQLVVPEQGLAHPAERIIIRTFPREVRRIRSQTG